jgi:hypothetical protein
VRKSLSLHKHVVVSAWLIITAEPTLLAKREYGWGIQRL